MTSQQLSCGYVQSVYFPKSSKPYTVYITGTSFESTIEASVRLSKFGDSYTVTSYDTEDDKRIIKGFGKLSDARKAYTTAVGILRSKYGKGIRSVI